MSADLSFTVTRTKADYFWAVAFNALRSPIIPIFFAFALLLALAPAALERDLDISDFAIVGVAYGGMVIFYYVALVVAVWMAARKNWSAPGALEPLSYTFTSEGINTSYAMGTGQTAWPLWKSAFETNELLLIRHTLGLLHIVPKRGLDSSALVSLRALLRDRFGEKARLRGQTP